jgi:NAD(P)H-hydrate epimerase
MTLPLAEDEAGRILDSAYWQIAERWSRTTAIACGPGLGRTRALQLFVRQLVEDAPLPCVIDADALNNLADGAGWPKHIAAPRVLTPHPGEWSRLCGVPASDLTAQRMAAIDFAKEHGVVVVLKGQHTLVTDGDTAYLNNTGTPAMATGGSGDVLTGIITALICQGLSPRAAAHLGVHMHGAAGQQAQAARGARVVLAEQLIEWLR